MSISEAKSKNQLPEVGTRCKSTPELKYTESECRGFFVQEKHIKARMPAKPGVYKGYVPGTGGDIWWVLHDDQTIAAYCSNEVEDESA